MIKTTKFRLLPNKEEELKKLLAVVHSSKDIALYTNKATSPDNRIYCFQSNGVIYGLPVDEAGIEIDEETLHLMKRNGEYADGYSLWPFLKKLKELIPTNENIILTTLGSCGTTVIGTKDIDDVCKVICKKTAICSPVLQTNQEEEMYPFVVFLKRREKL